jgi:hypothetical protein
VQQVLRSACVSPFSRPRLSPSGRDWSAGAARTAERDRYWVVEVPDPQRDAAGGYEAGVRNWHAARTAAYAEVVWTALPHGGTVGFLAWGDPALYDSTIRIVESVAALGGCPGLLKPGPAQPQLGSCLAGPQLSPWSQLWSHSGSFASVRPRSQTFRPRRDGTCWTKWSEKPPNLESV